MELIVDFFDNIPTEFRAGILVGGILVFWIFEGLIPLFRFKYKKVGHAGLNLFFTLTTAVIGFGLARVLLAASDLVSKNEFGLLYIFDLPIWAQMILGILLMDLVGAYFIHWTEHRVKWMWKFHVVHHSDTTVDVTTGLRHHPGETVFRISFTILAVIIIGAPMWIIMVYQSLSVLFAHLTHANINMPKQMDRALSWVFITPLMHKVHHHYTQPLTDTNYGNIFSIWDRLFGTFAQVENSRELVYGIDTHMDPSENNNIGSLLKIPFEPYRPPVGLKAEENDEL